MPNYDCYFNNDFTNISNKLSKLAILSAFIF